MNKIDELKTLCDNCLFEPEALMFCAGRRIAVVWELLAAGIINKKPSPAESVCDMYEISKKIESWGNVDELDTIHKA